MAPTAVFMGAHPDDIEIGAGGTAAKLIDAGWNIFWALTRPSTIETVNPSATRRMASTFIRSVERLSATSPTTASTHSGGNI